MDHGEKESSEDIAECGWINRGALHTSVRAQIVEQAKFSNVVCENFQTSQDLRAVGIDAASAGWGGQNGSARLIRKRFGEITPREIEAERGGGTPFCIAGFKHAQGKNLGGHDSGHP
jgi:hypothetical protein